MKFFLSLHKNIITSLNLFRNFTLILAKSMLFYQKKQINETKRETKIDCRYDGRGEEQAFLLRLLPSGQRNRCRGPVAKYFHQTERKPGTDR